MSEFIFNEKEGCYVPVSEASFGARMRAGKQSNDDLTAEILEVESRGNTEFKNLRQGYHAGEIEKAARQTSSYSTYKGKQSSTNTQKQSAKKGKTSVISIAFLIWIIVKMFQGDLFDSIERFFENFF